VYATTSNCSTIWRAQVALAQAAPRCRLCIMNCPANEDICAAIPVTEAAG
jgi:hypothetical protein